MRNISSIFHQASQFGNIDKMHCNVNYTINSPYKPAALAIKLGHLL